MTTVYEDYLAHHGVQGQKWGIRRFQNEDGTYTSEGRIHYDIGDPRMPGQNQNQNSNTNRSATSNVMNRPPVKSVANETEEEYQSRQRRLDITRKILFAAGGVTLAAAIGYGAYKGYGYLQKNMDTTMKSGTDIYRTQIGSGNAFNKAAYVSDNAEDAMRYRGGLTEQRLQIANQLKYIAENDPTNPVLKEWGGITDYGVHEVQGRANRDIKIAGDRTGKKVFDYLMKNDEKFREATQKSIKSVMDTVGPDQYQRSDYHKFNFRLSFHDEGSNEAAKRFYDELKKRGYGGIKDSNDRDYSEYRTNAKILFDTDAITQVKVRELNAINTSRDRDNAYDHVTKQFKKEADIQRFGQNALSLLPTGIGMIGIGALIGHTRSRNAGMRAYKDSINAYRQEHPATEKTDEEIYEMLIKDQKRGGRR